MKAAVLIALSAWARAAAADPPEPRVLTAPTAWLPAAGSAVGQASLDHRGAGSLVVDLGLGDVAAVELGVDSDVRACATPPCDTDRRADARSRPRAGFRLGARQDAWFDGQPAVVIGVRVTVGDPPRDRQRIGELYLVGSRTLGAARVHAGVELLDASGGDGAAVLGLRLRPVAGLELTPPQYPRTSLVADVAWVPRFDQGVGPALEWVVGWGVRYQALSWGAIELDVRHRGEGGDAEGLAASTVQVRVTGVWAGPGR